MTISIKSEEEIQSMRLGGNILNRCIEEVEKHVQEGVSTYELDQVARSFCKKNKVKPAFLGYNNYPSTMCIGVNDVVVHGIPSKDEILTKGDIVSLDMGIIYQGLYVDKAVTVGVGKVTKEASQLIETTRECLSDALDKAKSGNTIGDIGFAIESRSTSRGFSVVKQMVGHGVGRSLHEDPQIPGFGSPGEGLELKTGMTLAIEAIINQGTDEIIFLDDGWTTKTKDGLFSALFEDTVLVLDRSYEVLTR